MGVAATMVGAVMVAAMLAAVAMADGRGLGSRKDVSHVLEVELDLAQILF